MDSMKYQHSVSYITGDNSHGVLKINNDISRYKTSLQLNGLEEFIKEKTGFKSVIVSNILTVKKEN